MVPRQSPEAQHQQNQRACGELPEEQEAPCPSCHQKTGKYCSKTLLTSKSLCVACPSNFSSAASSSPHCGVLSRNGLIAAPWDWRAENTHWYLTSPGENRNLGVFFSTSVHKGPQWAHSTLKNKFWQATSSEVFSNSIFLWYGRKDFEDEDCFVWQMYIWLTVPPQLQLFYGTICPIWDCLIHCVRDSPKWGYLHCRLPLLQ